MAPQGPPIAEPGVQGRARLQVRGGESDVQGGQLAFGDRGVHGVPYEPVEGLVEGGLGVRRVPLCSS